MNKRKSKFKAKRRHILFACFIVIVVVIIAAAAIIIRSITIPSNSAVEDITVAPDVDITLYYYELPIYKCTDTASGTPSFSATSTADCSEQAFYLPVKDSTARVINISAGGSLIAYYDGERSLLYTRHTGELNKIYIPSLSPDQSTSYFVYADDGSVIGIAFFAESVASSCACSCSQNTDGAGTTHYHYFHNLVVIDYEFTDDNQLIIYNDEHSYATVYDSTGAIVDAYPITSE